jgi:hypothetical protein
VRTCRICTRLDRADIDQAIIAGESNRALATRFQGQGSLSPSAVDRHRRFHVGPALAAVQARREKKFADLVIDIEEDLIRLGAKAEAGGDVRAALLARRERIRLLELSARQSGELRAPASGSTTNIQVNLTQALTPEERARELREARLLLEFEADEQKDREALVTLSGVPAP